MSVDANIERSASERTPEADRLAAAHVEQAIESYTAVLQELQESHARLEDRAERVEAELCETNEELARKVEELDRVKQHLESVLTSIPTGVVVYDSEGIVSRANDAAVAILGVNREDLLGARTLEGLAGADADGTPTEVVCRDGAMRALARRYSPVSVASGPPAGAVEVIEDQSALVRAQERIHRLDKTAALGTMAGGIAHEIRNPLHGIQGFADLLAREAAGDSRATHFATRIREGVYEIEAIVASMLGIAGDGNLHIESFDVHDVIDEAVQAALQQRRNTYRWNIEVHGPHASLHADRIKLRQALRNLVANACDVQPDGGTVCIEAEPAPNGVRLLVTDAGPGLRPQDLHRLCDPFFTTRAEGTGLGLALVQRVAELHGGAFEPNTEPSTLGGAAFALTIPNQPA